ncbi:MAG: hypothetical protein IPL83_03880 [Bdellovibrionales bacterium]|nr:hypothetical protein [Bdellovibrionales bacterium]
MKRHSCFNFYFAVVFIFVLLTEDHIHALELSSDQKLNIEMTAAYLNSLSAGQTRNRNGQGLSIENSVISKGIDRMKFLGLKVVVDTSNIAPEVSVLGEDLNSHVEELYIQEFLRARPKGMPWLPLSWTTMGRSDVESSFRTNSRNLELILAKMYKQSPVHQDYLLRGYLFTGLVPHGNSNDLINRLRIGALELADLDPTFFDTRAEIHQDPSYGTTTKVRNYLAKVTNPEFKRRGEQVLADLLTLFGDAGVNEFLTTYDLESNTASAEFRRLSTTLRSISELKEVLRTATSPATVEGIVERTLNILDGLSRQSIHNAEQIHSIGEKTGNNQTDFADCAIDRTINCIYEFFDLSRLLQREIFSLGFLLQQQISKHGIPFTVVQTVRLLKSYFSANVSLGLSSPEAIAEFEESIAQLMASTKIQTSQFNIAVSIIESETRSAQQRIRDIFNPLIEKYTQFVEKSEAELVVDEILRSSTIQPMENILLNLSSKIAQSSGIRFTLNKENLSVPFRILNQGISKGVVYYPSESELDDPDFYWNPNGIYLLRKTSAQIHKVAGIIISHSGSLISHVQLITSNLGIPNVYMPFSTLEKIAREVNGKQILLFTLENGEASIKNLDIVNTTETEVYHKYNQVKFQEKIKLQLPTMEVFHPVTLDALRYDDKIAGGKAKGQGELAQLFTNTVPRGIVLPFSVYWHHINRKYLDPKTKKEYSLYDYIKALLADSRLKGDSKEASEFRRDVFLKIRRAISRIKLAPELESYIITKFTTRAPKGQVDFYERGVFVRSDTNAEDLATFVGAGLNDTVPNVQAINPGQRVSQEDLHLQHAYNVMEAIKSVWASPFTEKAYSWRKELIENPWDVVPSVLIQVGINSEKAGVMIVGDPQSTDFGDLIYIAANEGIGVTTVNGEKSPEVVTVSRTTGRVQTARTTNAKEKWALKAWPHSGLMKVSAGVIKPIITEDVARQLAKMGDGIQKQMASKYGYKNMKWDLEFCVLGNKAFLVQVRPFMGNQVFRNLALLKTLESKDETRRAENDRSISANDIVVELNQ